MTAQALPFNESLVYEPAANSKLRAIPVKTGISDGSFTEIAEGGLQQGQPVVMGISMPENAASRPESPRMPRRF
jgi:hypothetical protein